MLFIDGKSVLHPEVRRLDLVERTKLTLGGQVGNPPRQATHQDFWNVTVRNLRSISIRPRFFLRLLRAAWSRTQLVSVPVELCTNPFAFSYGQHGWHYWRDLASQVMEDPDIPLEEMRFYWFFKQILTPSYTALMSLHDRDMNMSLPEVPFRSYPWGVDNVRFHVDPDRFSDETKDDRTLNYMWFEKGPRVDAILAREYNKTVNLLNSIREWGFRPVFARRKGGFPSCTCLVSRDGEIRFIQTDGAHRLAVMSALGYETVPVQLDLKRFPPVFEEDVDNWRYVKSGLVSRTAALRFFQLYFSLNGMERAEALGVCDV